MCLWRQKNINKYAELTPICRQCRYARGERKFFLRYFLCYLDFIFLLEGDSADIADKHVKYFSHDQ